MRVPLATYRVQLQPEFGFAQTREILGYLADLGISDLYASPLFRARPGSAHGYDVVDPTRLNPELGSEAEFAALGSEVARLGMGWLQDIVPNHMAYDSSNPYLMDVLESGEHSVYRDFFDIDWTPPFESLRGRVLAPFLGSFYGQALENGDIRLRYGAEGFHVTYYDLRFPLAIESYPELLTPAAPELRRRLGEDHPDYERFLGILYTLRTLPGVHELEERRTQVRFIKRLLWDLYRSSARVRSALDQTLEALEGRPGEPETFNPLDRLLAEQRHRLCFWKVATEEINYRRFFSINDLISVRVEDEGVFRETHALVLDLLRSGAVTGLRVDHVDGLYDPRGYLSRLGGTGAYLVVEKILQAGEELPEGWPVQGTTGYDFLAAADGLLVHPDGARPLDRLYASFTGWKGTFADLVYEKKKLILYRHMAGDLDNLARLLKEISSSYRHGSDITLYGLRRAMVEVLASFPVYRTYGGEDFERGADVAHIRSAVDATRGQYPDLANELDFLEQFLLLRFEAWVPASDRQQWVHFLRRFQQYTGPLMAKGVEDTALYVYNRLLVANEVGGAPDRFGVPVEDFHAFNVRRLARWPHTLNATATHDTKRGEDVRARLAVLSELPGDWRDAVRRWMRLNRRHRRRAGRRTMPDRNDEYFLYQTLVGAWPFGEGEVPAFRDRLREYLVKAVREAKVHTAWLKPDTEYEEAFLAFGAAILREGSPFLEDFLPFQRRVARHGILNSLSRLLLKVASPGVPDFYQGTELWDLSLVDPDNRRPVDYGKRRKMLAALRQGFGESQGALLTHLLARPEDGRVKLFLTERLLKARAGRPAVFEEGDYLPVTPEGPRADHVVAFLRRAGRDWALAVAPRYTAGLADGGVWPWGLDAWQGTRLPTPPDAPTSWTDTLTGASVAGEGPLPVGQLLSGFPAALLVGEGPGV